LLQKSFSTADQNFSSPLVRFADKYVGDLVSFVKNSQAALPTAWVPY